MGSGSSAIQITGSTMTSIRWVVKPEGVSNVFLASFDDFWGEGQ